MTYMKICILDADEKLTCGEAHCGVIPIFVPNLKPEMEHVEDVINAINKAHYPWNLNYYEGDHLHKQKATTTSFGLNKVADIPASDLTEDNLVNFEGNLFIDLKNKAIVHLDSHSPESHKFPKSLTVYKFNDPNVERKTKLCESSIPKNLPKEERWKAERKCRDKYITSRKRMPKGFTIATVHLDHIPQGEQYRRDNQVAIEGLIDQIKKSNHPSKTFYRSLASVLEQNDYTDIWQEK